MVGERGSGKGGRGGGRGGSRWEGGGGEWGGGRWEMGLAEYRGEIIHVCITLGKCPEYKGCPDLRESTFRGSTVAL